MTTNPSAEAANSAGYLRLPDAPDPEDANTYLFRHCSGNTHHLAMHPGNQETTIMMGYDGRCLHRP